jgi:hypothetical protein
VPIREPAGSEERPVGIGAYRGEDGGLPVFRVITECAAQICEGRLQSWEDREAEEEERRQEAQAVEMQERAPIYEWCTYCGAQREACKKVPAMGGLSPSQEFVLPSACQEQQSRPRFPALIPFGMLQNAAKCYHLLRLTSVRFHIVSFGIKYLCAVTIKLGLKRSQKC